MSAEQESVTEVEELRDTVPIKWDKTGRAIEGTLVNLHDYLSQFSGEYVLWGVVENASGTQYSFTVPTMLARLLHERWGAKIIAIGKPIKVKYLGDKPMKSGKGKIKLFSVWPDLPIDALQRMGDEAMKRLSTRMAPTAPENVEPLSPEKRAEAQADFERANLSDSNDEGLEFKADEANITKG